MGKWWKHRQTLFPWAPKSLQMVTAAMKLKDTPWKKSNDKARKHIKKQRYYFTDKGPYSQNYSVSSSYMWMWELNHEKGWAPKKWCFWTIVLQKTFEGPLDCKENKPVNPQGNQSWIFTVRSDAAAEAPKFGHLMWRTDSFEKNPDPGKDWRQEEKGTTEDEMNGWYPWLNGHEYEQAPGVGDG